MIKKTKRYEECEDAKAKYLSLTLFASAIAFAICVGFLMSLVFVSVDRAFAYERIDTDAQCSLEVCYVDDSVYIEGVEFFLYKIADISDAVELSYTEDFADSSVDLSSIETSSDWTDAATTWKSYALAQGIEPVDKAITNENGSVTFSDLSVGLYLVVGKNTVFGDYLYMPAPTCVYLPNLTSEDEWNYNPTINVKHDKEPAEANVDLSVNKVWNDNNYSKRPKSVYIQLIRDGEAIDVVTLSESNSWKHTWEDLSLIKDSDTGEVYTYTVNETEVESGYSVKISESGDFSYTVTNTYSEAASNSGNSNNKSSTLPQTGQTKWPIPVLCVVGLLLLCLGIYFRRGLKRAS